MQIVENVYLLRIFLKCLIFTSVLLYFELFVYHMLLVIYCVLKPINIVGIFYKC